MDPWQNYPSRLQLKKEVKAIAGAYVTTLLQHVPKDSIAGVYWKGSSVKRWDSPIDYVPNVSDVDIHIRFKKGSLQKLFKDIPEAIKFSSEVERKFFEKIKKPIHVPGLQLKDLNQVESMPNYLPSPESSVKTLFGVTYPAHDINEKKGLVKVRTDLLAHKEYLRTLPALLTDKQDVHIQKYLGEFDSKVSPTGPGILCMWGMEYEKAWSLNRTSIVRYLRKRNPELAANYAAFYLHAWKFFLTKEIKHVREAILCGTFVLEQGIKLAEG